MILRSSKTDRLPARELSLNIERGYGYASVLPSSLHLIQLIISMGVELDSDSLGNAAKNAWN